MSKKCEICRGEIFEDSGKLKGTMLKIVDSDKTSRFIYVCSGCQKDARWIEKAKVKSA